MLSYIISFNVACAFVICLVKYLLTYLLTYLLDHAVRRRVRISVLQVADADIVAVTLNVMFLAW